MISELKALLDIGKDAPDAVGYSVAEAISFPLPEEVAESLPDGVTKDLSKLILLHVSIYNYSSKSQRNIRVLYAGDWELSPSIAFDRREVSVKYSINEDEKEIVIDEIPPNESVYLNIFNPYRGFKIDQVLLGDKKITGFMQRLAEAKRFPGLIRLKAVTAIMFLALIACIAFVGYKVLGVRNEVSANNAEMAALLKNSGLCRLYSYRNDKPDDLDIVLLTKNIYPLEKVLGMNNVSTMDELRSKKTILLCSSDLEPEE